MLFIANYLLDALPADIFSLKKGQLSEKIFSVGTPMTCLPDIFDPTIILNMKNDIRSERVPDPKAHYSNSTADVYMNDILDYYQKTLGQETASFLLPISPIQLLHRISGFSKKESFFMITDKGVDNIDTFIERYEPDIVLHGSFSIMYGSFSIFKDNISIFLNIIVGPICMRLAFMRNYGKGMFCIKILST